MTQLSSSINEFTVQFFKAFAASNQGNALFSPWSILNGFAMVLVGSRGNTEDEILSCLSLENIVSAANETPKDLVVHDLIRKTDELLKKACSEGTFLEGANKVWISKSYKVLDSYMSYLRSYYKVDVGEADFQGDSQGARKEINAWVEKETREKIKDLFPDGSIDGLTRVVLANAMYFKGLWETPFDKKKTRKDKFFISSTDTVDVDMMFVSGKFPMCFDKDLKLNIVELPYREKKFSMLLLIPQEKMGYQKVEEHLSADMMSSWHLEETRMSTHIFVPKFRLSIEVGLKELLQSLSMRDVFSETDADLSGISGIRDLYVSCAFHKAFVEVDEEGTEAAAATGIGINYRSMPMQIRADHPFFFMIKERESNATLFFARVINPST